MTDPASSPIYRAARVLFAEGDVVEVRVLNAGRLGTISGYFDNLETLAKDVARLDAGGYPGVYWTLNPVNRALFSRAVNRTKPYARATTKDENIDCRRWLPIDLDPIRPKDISSSDEEHEAALQLSVTIRDELRAMGWGDGIRSDSGNGAHLLYRIELPNDEVSKILLERATHALAARFGTPVVDIDLTTFNASRVFKAYGTVARKGDHTEERPHRRARVLELPELLPVVPRELLEALAASAPEDPQRRSVPSAPSRRYVGPAALPPFDLEGFLAKYGVRHRAPAPWEGGHKYVLEECPFDVSHKAPDSSVFVGPSGRLGFKCLHNSCHGRDWREFRELFEGPRPVRRFQQEAPAPWPEEFRDGRCENFDAGAAAEEEGSAAREVALSPADVEAAIHAACEAKDWDAAARLIPEVAKVPLASYTLILGKLRRTFKRDFPARDFKAAVQALRDAQNAPPPPPDDDDEPPADAPNLIGFPLTDSGNGERIVKLYGEDIRFCSEFKKWLLWDGRRWKVDTDAATVTQKAKQMARLLYQQGALSEDPVMRKLLQAHARESESQGAITAALLRAKSEPGMAISASQLDQHRYLLNCLNGVVDVRTGELMEFKREYYITKLCAVNYRPDSTPERDCPRFMKFLYWAMGDSPDLAELPEKVTRMVAFLQKAIGYSLTGDVSEKAAFVFYGARGNNGKTTLLTIFKTILAEYATQLDINTLMTSKFTDNNVRADLAKLHGARFVITSEVDDGMRLSERLMKYLTAGMGEVTACRKFENPFEFLATHKLFMDCNYRPEVKGADEAIWSRLKCVPFLRRIEANDPEIDKQLLGKILAESEGVLAWAVRGAMRWAKDAGLGDPPEVKDAGAEWRDADDPLKEFIEECTESDPDYWVRCRDLATAYTAWCKDNNEKFVLSRTRFGQRLELKGYKLNRSRRLNTAGDESPNGTQQRCWDGLRLREDVTLVSAPRGAHSGVTREF